MVTAGVSVTFTGGCGAGERVSTSISRCAVADPAERAIERYTCRQGGVLCQMVSLARGYALVARGGVAVPAGSLHKLVSGQCNHFMVHV